MTGKWNEALSLYYVSVNMINITRLTLSHNKIQGKHQCLFNATLRKDMFAAHI